MSGVDMSSQISKSVLELQLNLGNATHGTWLFSSTEYSSLFFLSLRQLNSIWLYIGERFTFQLERTQSNSNDFFVHYRNTSMLGKKMCQCHPHSIL